jgi:hypothetical protein
VVVLCGFVLFVFVDLCFFVCGVTTFDGVRRLLMGFGGEWYVCSVGG